MHSNSGASVVSQNTLNYGQSKVKKVHIPAKGRKGPYPSVKWEKEYKL